MNKSIKIVCIFLFSSPTLASEYVYSSLQLGKATHKVDSNKMDNNPLAVGINTAVLYGEEDLKFGYNANINYLTLDKNNGSFNSLSSDISPIISYHLTNNLNLYSKIGLSYTSTKYDLQGVGKTKDNSIGITYGAGFNYVFKGNFFIGAEIKMNQTTFEYYDVENMSYLINIGITNI